MSLVCFGDFELFSPSAEDRELTASVKRKSKLYVRTRFTVAGVKNKNGHKLLLEDIKEALPTLLNSYIRDTHHGPVVGTCYRAEIAEPDNPQSLVWADYVVWRTKETIPFVEKLLKAHADNSMGVSWEVLYGKTEKDPTDDSIVLKDIEFAGAGFTQTPAYVQTLGFLELAEVEEMLITGTCYASATDDEKGAQEARSKKYGISIHEGGNVTKPGEYSSVSDDEFADPVNYAYPCDSEERTRAALHYWGMPRNKEKYSSGDQGIINKRLARFAKKFNIESELVKEAEVEEKIKELEQVKADLEAQLQEKEKVIAETQVQLKEREEALANVQKELDDLKSTIEREKLQATRVQELGDLVEKDKDYASMSEAEFKIYKLEHENELLRKQTQSNAGTVPLGKIEKFGPGSKAKEILEKI
jgi:hypothetical protein